MITATASECSPKYASSSTAERVFVLTAIDAPPVVQANQARTNSGQFSRWMMIRSPGSTPRRRSPAASRATSWAKAA